MDALASLQYQMEEHHNVGAPVEVFLELPRDLSAEELGILEAQLRGGGLELLSSPEIGALSDLGENVLRLSFRRPARPTGIGVFPLAALLVLALGAVGISAIVGWRLGDVVTKMGQNLIPLALIAGAVLILVTYAKKGG